PFGSDIIVYRECAMQLTEAVMKLLSKIKEG
ncbi:MAG TPA: protein tyrosine phosphatase, partial [Clostridiaceae bacterium]|nr:protein tyrosine phosphatase [Clostridiaceae bacterium]HBF76904.1 protein tyrosine phosphatase [Clostridiaceae bacterium]HBG39383.1 protein tyrosine phosphatase [Clostridiaceae bacterium]